MNNGANTAEEAILCIPFSFLLSPFQLLYGVVVVSQGIVLLICHETCVRDYPLFLL